MQALTVKRSDVTGLNAFDEFQRALDLHLDDTASDLESPYKQLPSYYAGTRVIYDALMRGEWELWEGDANEAKKIVEGPLYELFRKPNSAQTWRQFISQMVVMLHGKKGAAYIQLAGRELSERTPKGWPEELRLIPPSRVQHVPEARDLFKTKHWEVRRGHGEPAKIAANDIVPIFVAPDDELPWTAVSPLEPGQLDNDSERMAGHYTRSTLRSGGTPGILFSYRGEAEIPDDDREVIEAKLEARYGGAKGSRFAVVSGEWGVDNLGFAPRDMEFAEWRRQHVLITSRLLGVTPLVLSQFEGATGLGDAGLRVQRRILYENKVLPLASTISEALNEGIVRPLTEGVVEGIYNFDKVEALQEDVGQKLVALDLLVRNGVTLERSIEWLDLGIDVEDHAWAKTHLVQSQLVPAEVIADPASFAPAPEVEAADATKALPTISPQADQPVVSKTGKEVKVDNEAALNGAQLASIMDLLIKLREGLLPRDAVKGILEVGFNLDDAEADRIIGSTKAMAPAERDVLVAAVLRALPVDKPIHAVVFSRDKFLTAQSVLNWLRIEHDEAALVDAIEEGKESWAFLVRRRVDFVQQSLREIEVEPGVIVVTGDLRPGNRLLTSGASAAIEEPRHLPPKGGSAPSAGLGLASGATAVADPPEEDDPIAQQRAIRVATEQNRWVRALRAQENDLDAKLVRALQKMSRNVMRTFQREAKTGLRGFLRSMAAVAEHDATAQEIDRLASDPDVVRRAPAQLTQAQIDAILAQVDAISLANVAASTVSRSYKVGTESGWKILKDMGVKQDGLLDFQRNRMPLLVTEMVDRYLPGSPLVRVNDAIRNEVNTVILAGLEEGDGVEAIAKEIRGVFRASLQRSRTIARTETNIAMSAGKMDLFVDQGVEEHEWIAIIDDNTRGSHMDAHGEKAAVGQPFPYVGLRYPGDTKSGAGPEEIINCRCTTIPVSLRDRDIDTKGGSAAPPSVGTPKEGPLPFSAKRDSTLPPSRSATMQEIHAMSDRDLTDYLVVPSGEVSERFLVDLKEHLHSFSLAERRLLAAGKMEFHLTDFVTTARPDLKGVTPRGWPEGSTWDEADGFFQQLRDAVYVTEKRISRTYSDDGTPTAVFSSLKSTRHDRSRYTLSHESGHAMDFAIGKVTNGRTDVAEAGIGGSLTSRFREAYDLDLEDLMRSSGSHLGVPGNKSFALKNDAAKLEYFIQPDPYDGRQSSAGMQEAFAEAFAEIHGGDPSGNEGDVFKKAFPRTIEAVKKLVDDAAKIVSPADPSPSGEA